MPDQANKLRQLIAAAEPATDAEWPLPPTIAVAGGKGGAGATTVALNLAVALAHSGCRTALVDAAPYADIAHLAGIDDSIGACLDDVVAGKCDVTDTIHPGPGGICVLAGRSAAAEPLERSSRAAGRLLHRLPALSALVDAVIVDIGSGMTPWTREFWRRTGLVLLVTTADDTAVMDAYATIKRAGADEATSDVRVLINRCDDATAAADAERRITNACRRFLGQTVGRAPRLPRHDVEFRGGMKPPCAWEMPNSTFGRSVSQLGRFAADVLSMQRRADARAAVCHHPSPEFSTC